MWVYFFSLNVIKISFPVHFPSKWRQNSSARRSRSFGYTHVIKPVFVGTWKASSRAGMVGFRCSFSETYAVTLVLLFSLFLALTCHQWCVFSLLKVSTSGISVWGVTQTFFWKLPNTWKILLAVFCSVVTSRKQTISPTTPPTVNVFTTVQHNRCDSLLGRPLPSRSLPAGESHGWALCLSHRCGWPNGQSPLPRCRCAAGVHGDRGRQGLPVPQTLSTYHASSSGPHELQPRCETGEHQACHAHRLLPGPSVSHPRAHWAPQGQLCCSRSPQSVPLNGYLSVLNLLT